MIYNFKVINLGF